MGKLTALEVKRLSKPGKYGLGGNLYIQVRDARRKSWLVRYMIAGKAREMGLGPIDLIPLVEARQKVLAARRLLLDGVDPLEQRQAAKAARLAKAAAALTFRACAEKYVKNNQAAWKSTKHALQWNATLERYVYPAIGELGVAEVDTGHVTRILEAHWTTKPETASRVRGRIEAVLDYARVHGWRDGENPARWRGHLDNVFPRRSKVAAVQHHAALPWLEMDAFMRELRGQEGVAARALEFTIYTACRTAEAIGATWAEIDLEEKVWTIPPERMKAGREHRVPLSAAALVIVSEVAKGRQRSDEDGFVFPGLRDKKPLSNMALLMTLRRMKRGDLTTHGFRSSFRDWAAETGRPADIAEAALAHTLGSKTVVAYQRGDLLTRRRQLMNDWAEHCGQTSAAVAG